METAILGVEFHEDGFLRPDRLKLAELISFTKLYVKLRKRKRNTLQSVLGR